MGINIWQGWAIDELKAYASLKEFIESIPERMKMIDASMEGMNGISFSAAHARGGQRDRADRYAAAIDRKDELERQARSARMRVGCIDQVLDSLDEDRRIVLQRFFIFPEKGAAERLADDLGVEIKTVYRLRTDALEYCTTALFGRAH